MHNLTLLNPPYGPPETYPFGLMTLPVWTFAFMRRRLGQDPARWRFKGVGLAVALPAEELAMWHADLMGRVPDELAGCLCAVENGLFGAALMNVTDAVPLPGGSLFLRRLWENFGGQQQFENLMLLPRAPWDTPGGPRCRGPQRSIPPSPALDAAASAPQPPLCQLGLPFATEPNSVVAAESVSWKLSPVSLTKVPLDALKASMPDTQYTKVLVENGRFILSRPKHLTKFYESFSEAQAMISGAALWLGDPLGPRLLHLSFAPATVNVRAPNATLALRQLVLVGLPTAGLHALSPALGIGVDRSRVVDLTEAQAAGEGPETGDGAGSEVQPQADDTAHGARGWRRLLSDKTASAASQDAIGLAAGRNNHRQAQALNVDGIFLSDGPPAGTDPTGGLPHGLANFTSCLWALDFDRSAPRDPPAVFLDSVVLLVPPGELAVLAAAWAEQLAAEGKDGSDESVGAGGAFALAPAASDAGAVLAHLAASLRASRLSAGTTPASLQRLTARLRAMQQQQAAAASAAGGDDGAGAALLAFETLSWCGLAGRNVTLTAELQPAVWLSAASATQPAAGIGPSASDAVPQVDPTRPLPAGELPQGVRGRSDWHSIAAPVVIGIVATGAAVLSLCVTAAVLLALRRRRAAAAGMREESTEAEGKSGASGGCTVGAAGSDAAAGQAAAESGGSGGAGAAP
ncbi:hypothetical protein GPECTOR_16g573 [Gonium pectorale]|uniref:Uncharacterized protein n=1 Tax=Gonium pectorale TaxID=33097 RepID=A0A150GM51_GONPE|nr:hypothetical protein GPECTOR_16g573 [Gonium pectorale]|eukprot:KXZ50400.1 hypothetical protein GPECTOR_16g573 [Gonium pectorale]